LRVEIDGPGSVHAARPRPLHRRRCCRWRAALEALQFLLVQLFGHPIARLRHHPPVMPHRMMPHRMMFLWHCLGRSGCRRLGCGRGHWRVLRQGRGGNREDGCYRDAIQEMLHAFVLLVQDEQVDSKDALYRSPKHGTEPRSRSLARSTRSTVSTIRPRLPTNDMILGSCFQALQWRQPLTNKRFP